MDGLIIQIRRSLVLNFSVKAIAPFSKNRLIQQGQLLTKAIATKINNVCRNILYMSSLKAKIVKQLDSLSDNALQQVSDFIEFLTWRKMASVELESISAEENLERKQDIAWLETDLSNLGEYEPYEWQTGELETGLAIEIDPEKGVVIVEE